MPRKKTKKILALSPGKRCLGICVMENGEPVTAGVRTFKGKGKEKQASDYAAHLIGDVDPDVLAMETRSTTGHSFGDELHEAIGKAAERLEVKVRLHSTEKVKRSLCGDDRATRYEVAGAVAERDPELKRCLFEKGSEKEKYRRAMFEAVALGMM